MRRLVKPIVTMGYIGCLKVAPGSFASAAAVAIAWFAHDTAFLVAISTVTLVVGLALCKPATEVLASKDPRPFVLDEWCGMTISLVFVPMNAVTLAAAFILFRVFDVWKPFGVGRIDQWKHPWSIMLDDVLAGLYANLCMQVLLKITPIAGF